MTGSRESAQRIEDYALIGNCLTAALVGRNGSIDWLCFPRFDSPACFAALLGDRMNGRWQIAPAEDGITVERRYRPETMVLETRFRTKSGSVLVTDFMPLPAGRDGAPAPDRSCIDLVRIIRGERGSVPMKMEMIFRFDYGSIVPWVRRRPDGLSAIAGPDALLLRTPIDMVGRDQITVSEFTIHAGETIPCTLSWYRSHEPEPAAYDAEAALHETVEHWQAWSRRYQAKTEWREAELRSLLTLKALTYQPTGGIVAAPTTSLPEKIGGVRNWDYRFCWLRDATFTLYALLLSGYREEAQEWREWLLRAVAGSPSEVQVMYSLAGARRLPEYELPALGGFRASRPVRIGNAAHTQRQTDIFGEVMDAFYSARLHGIEPEDDALKVQQVMLEFLETHWQLPDSGIWEIRGRERRNTHSAVMAWVAFDRAIKSVGRFGLVGPLERWSALRNEIHRQVCHYGVDHERGVFVQAFGGKALDSALAAHPARRISAARRSARHRHRRRGRARPHRAWLRPTLSAERGPGRHAAFGRRVPDLLFLARRQFRADGTRDGSTRAVRAAARHPQRCRAACRRIRSGREMLPRQLPAGFLACRADQHRAQSRARQGPGRPPRDALKAAEATSAAACRRPGHRSPRR